MEALLGLENLSHAYMYVQKQASRSTRSSGTPRMKAILVDQISAKAQEHWGIEGSHYDTAFTDETQVIFWDSYGQIDNHRSCLGHDWRPCC